MTNTTPFTLSIEPTGKPAFVHGFHLGTDEKIARQIAEEMFHGRNRANDFTCTVALLRNGRLFAVYDGIWNNYSQSWHKEIAESHISGRIVS